jgi:hypothetical protein
MSLVTTPRNIPNLFEEYHVVTIDSIGQSSANSFTCHLQTPLHNVVQARLLAASIHTKESVQHVYVKIDELNTNFNDRAFTSLESQGSLARVRGSFASLISEVSDHTGAGDQLLAYKDNYMVTSQYITPIRSIDRFTVSLLDEDGNPVPNPAAAGDNFLVIRFTCSKTNL